MSVTLNHRHHEPEVWAKAWENRKFVFLMIHQAIRKYRHVAGYHRFEAEEFLAVGIESYCRALETYDPSTATHAFLTHAGRVIKKGVWLEVKDMEEPIHIPYHKRKSVDLRLSEAVDAAKIDIVDPISLDDDDDDDEWPEIIRKVHDSLGRIAPRNAVALRLIYGIGGEEGGLSYRQVAERMGLGMKNCRGAVGQYRARGLEQMRKRLEEAGMAS